MKLVDLARQLRPLIEKGAQSLTDDEALNAVPLFPVWQANTAYTTGQRVQYDGTLYSVLQDHTSEYSRASVLALYSRLVCHRSRRNRV